MYRDEYGLLGADDEGFRLLFDHAAIGMALVDLDGRLVRVNTALAGMLGYGEDELVDRLYHEITHPDDVPLEADHLEQLVAGELDVTQMEKRYLTRAGRDLWAILSISLVRGADGTPHHFIHQAQDIDARKRAEDAVLQSEKRLAEAQQMARIGSWEWNVATDVVTWSDELYRLFGVDADSRNMSYDQYLETVHPDDREALEVVVRHAFESGEPFSVEHRVLLAGGGVRWIHGRGEVERVDGTTVSMRGTAQDITERRNADDRLAEAERRYRTLIEQLPLVTYIRPLDMSGTNVYVSPQVEDVIGTSPEEWTSNPNVLAETIHPDDLPGVVAEGRRLRRTGEPIRQEYRYVTDHKGIVWVLDETHVVCDEHGKPRWVQGYLLDITERKRAEEERDRLRDELHHAQKLEAIGRLAGGVAHDFNNTLTAIKGYSELMLDSLDAGGMPRREAEQIRRAAEQASALPRQLLAFSRKQVLQPGLLDLDAVVQSASELLTQLVGETISITTAPGAASERVLADASQIEQILLNLVVNARDAMPDGGTIAIATRLETLAPEKATEHEVEPGEYVVLSVADTGQGMDAETKARAFEPFFTTKAPGHGSGLGLATAYGTVRQSGGLMRVESELGQGSTFEIYLPCAGIAELVELESSKPTPPGPASILLVEDEEMVRDVALTALERAGYRVLAAGAATEALEIWSREPIDVLVTDMVMPGMSGRELADRILHLAPATPVVFMSGYTDEAPVVEIGSAVPSFLQKPFSPSTLVDTVRAALDTDALAHTNGDQAATNGRRPTCLVADDHPAVLDSVSRYLERRGFDVVARVSRGDDALEEIRKSKPTLALLDVGMSPLTGIDVAERVRLEAPECRVVVFTGTRDSALLERALDAGARGFVLKEAPLSELERALHVVAEGGTYVAPELASSLVAAGSESERSPLTPRERQVLALLADGQTNESASKALGISAETIQSHVRNVMGKLEADTRTQAVATAIRQSLID